jgi:glutaredoxin
MNYLSQKGVSFTSKDIANDSQAFDEFVQLHSAGTPTIVVDGKVIVGFDRAGIDAALSS